jgi:hypothetical protein
MTATKVFGVLIVLRDAPVDVELISGEERRFSNSGALS